MIKKLNKKKVEAMLSFTGLTGLSFNQIPTTTGRVVTRIDLPEPVNVPAGYELHVYVEARPRAKRKPKRSKWKLSE